MKQLTLGFVALLVWLGWEVAESLAELFLTQLEEKKKPECLTAMFPAQWAA